MSCQPGRAGEPHMTVSPPARPKEWPSMGCAPSWSAEVRLDQGPAVTGSALGPAPATPGWRAHALATLGAAAQRPHGTALHAPGEETSGRAARRQHRASPSALLDGTGLAGASPATIHSARAGTWTRGGRCCTHLPEPEAECGSLVALADRGRPEASVSVLAVTALSAVGRGRPGLPASGSSSPGVCTPRGSELEVPARCVVSGTAPAPRECGAPCHS
jgi:hypothetical protein